MVAAGGGAVEMTPDPLKPVLTLHAATLRLPVVLPDDPDVPGRGRDDPREAEGPPLRFEPPSRQDGARRRCASRRHFTIRLRRSFVKARVIVSGRPTGVFRRRGRLRARVDLRGMPRKTAVVRIIGVTRSGRRIVATRSYRPCATKRRTSRRWKRS